MFSCLFSNTIRSTAVGSSLVVLLFLAPGCSREELPKTYIVQGKVVSKSGKPFSGGLITFSSVANPEHRAYGEIGKDGTFTLDTIALRSDATSGMLKGGVEGDFVVSIRPAGIDADEIPAGNIRGQQEFTLKKRYTIEAKELNEITVVFE